MCLQLREDGKLCEVNRRRDVNRRRMMSTGANSHEPTHAASRMLSVEVSASLAPQALETGDFGIVVPIVFIPAIFRNSWQHGRR